MPSHVHHAVPCHHVTGCVVVSPRPALKALDCAAQGERHAGGCVPRNIACVAQRHGCPAAAQGCPGAGRQAVTSSPFCLICAVSCCGALTVNKHAMVPRVQQACLSGYQPVCLLYMCSACCVCLHDALPAWVSGRAYVRLACKPACKFFEPALELSCSCLHNRAFTRFSDAQVG